MQLPTLNTERLTIRPFTLQDLDDIFHLLDQEAPDRNLRDADSEGYAARRRWLEWTVSGYEQYALMHQPPLGDRAVCLRETGELIGVVGYVPCLDAFGQLPFGPQNVPVDTRTSEYGLFWEIASPHRKQGYATEAARALVEYAFAHLQIARIVATTEYANLASQAVMTKLGMRIERNPLSTPPWLQVVGILEIA